MTVQTLISMPDGWGAARRRPVFLHSGFRAGSTWFWNRFRECADTYAYCEPFNVNLAALTPEQIAATRPDAWPSGHPATMRPYYTEFEPLLAPAGGVLLYEPRFGIETYFSVEADPAMQRYIALLVDHAQRHDKIPILGFCCSLGRLEWFRRFADGWNIVTWRNPRDQWLSCHRLLTEHGNFHFEVHYLLVAYIARRHPHLASFFDGLAPLPSPAEIVSSMPLFTEPDGVDQRFRMFLRVFALDMLLAIQNADLVVDLDRLGESDSYRADMTHLLRTVAGLPELSFDDCRLPRHTFCNDADYRTMLYRERDFLEAFALTQAARAFDKSLPFVRDALARLIAEEI